jgi:hypothetical protein
MADMLERVMAEHPEQKLIVLSGHTHYRSRSQVTDNIESRIAVATRGLPQIEEIISI